MTDLQGLWHGARRLLPWMIDLRRAIHQEPELGMEEFRTAARMVETLRELDIPCQSGVAGAGVVGAVVGAVGGLGAAAGTLSTAGEAPGTMVRRPAAASAS